MSSIEVGSTVKIINTGNQYNAYEEMAEKMGLDAFTKFKHAATGLQGIVVAIDTHPNTGEQLYAVKVGDFHDYDHFIFGVRGLELIDAPVKAKELKMGWSVKCGEREYDAFKALLVLMGYRVSSGDVYHDLTNTMCYNSDPVISQSSSEKYNHFDNITDFLVWAFDDKAELKAELQRKLKEVAELQAAIAA